jgi:hypothetical protein
VAITSTPVAVATASVGNGGACGSGFWMVTVRRFNRRAKGIKVSADITPWYRFYAQPFQCCRSE